MSCRAPNMLDMPDEILVEIILYLNPRERLKLANVCWRLNRIVFEEKRSLRCLDFSKDGYLTSMSELRQYFNNKKKYIHIQRLNVCNIYCTTPAQLMQNIRNAINLVELNVIGISFNSMKHLASFLRPLKQLKMLSVNWPSQLCDDMYSPFLAAVFGSLTHLKILVNEYFKSLLYELESCKELEELFLLEGNHQIENEARLGFTRVMKKLDKLRIAVFYGWGLRPWGWFVMSTLSDLEEWNLFQLSSNFYNLSYYEKNHQQRFKSDSEVFDVDASASSNPAAMDEVYYTVLVERSEEMKIFLQSLIAEKKQQVSPSKGGEENLCFIWDAERLSKNGSTTVKTLLQQVIMTRDPQAKNELCCLSADNSCTLTLQDTRLLINNLRHQISILHIHHDIEPHCDVHSLASTFPTLKKLVLSRIVKCQESPTVRPQVSPARNRGRIAHGEQSEASRENNSFKKLVENTPLLEELTVCPGYCLRGSIEANNRFDSPALDLIAGWERLTNLCLAHIPIQNGRFLSKIAKHCPNLEKLSLNDLGNSALCCYTHDLQLMLANVHNLKDFSLQQPNFGQISHIFNTLATKTKLRRVVVNSSGSGNNVVDLPSSIHRLAKSEHLVLLVCEIEGMTKTKCDELKSALQRLKNHSNHSNFQFDIIWPNGLESHRNSALSTVHKDLLHSRCHVGNDIVPLNQW